jgi:hypothetical protein
MNIKKLLYSLTLLIFNLQIFAQLGIVVNKNLYPFISIELQEYSQYLKDYEEKQLWESYYYFDELKTVQELKDSIISNYNDIGLEGVILIGDLPIAEFEIKNDYDGYSKFPIDYYYMDIDGNWEDNALDGDWNGSAKTNVFDDHTGNTSMEIWMSRITASILNDYGDEIYIVNDYLRRLVKRHLGNDSMQQRHLITGNDYDWPNLVNNSGSDILGYDEDSVRIYIQPDDTEENWKNAIRSGFEYANLFEHSSALSNTFSSGGYFSNAEYISMKDEPEGISNTRFYNLFACSNARYTYNNCLGALYAYGHNGLIAIGSTKTGAMKNFFPFNQWLGNGKSFGEAFKYWINNAGINNRNFCYGMTLLGAGTLRLHRYEHWRDSLPDLYINKFTISNNKVDKNEEFILFLDIENTGLTVADSSVLKLFITDTYISYDDSIKNIAAFDSLVIDSISPASVISRSIIISLPDTVFEFDYDEEPYPYKEYYLYAVIDANNQVFEKNEYQKSQRLIVLALETGKLDCSGAIPLISDTTYSGNIINGSSNVDIYYDQLFIPLYFYGNEVVHSFIPDYSGRAKIEFSTDYNEKLDYFVFGSCNEMNYETKIINPPSIPVMKNTTYYVVVDNRDVFNDYEYSLKVYLPDSCPQPEISASKTMLCEGDYSRLSTDKYMFESYNWYFNDSNISDIGSIYVYDQGEYHVKVTENECTGSSDTVKVFVSPKPKEYYIEAHGVTEFCDGDNVLLELVTDSSASFSWNFNGDSLEADSKWYYAGNEGYYYANVKNEFCTIRTNTIYTGILSSPKNIGEGLEVNKNNLIIYCPFNQDISNEAEILYWIYSRGNPTLTKDRFGNENNSCYFNGVNDIIYCSEKFNNPQIFTISFWFKTSSTTGGKIIGFGNERTDASSYYDRHIYMDNEGYIYFGVKTDICNTLSSDQPYNDNKWHFLAARLSAKGMYLYIDGNNIAGNPEVVSAEDFEGYWRIGFDELNGWPDKPSSDHFEGTLDDILIYYRELSDQVITQLYKGQIIEIHSSDFINCLDSAKGNIHISNSQLHTVYQPVNAQDLSYIGMPVIGNEEQITLETNILNSVTPVKILATDSETGCKKILDTTLLFVVNQIPDPTIEVKGQAVLCKGDSVEISCNEPGNYRWLKNEVLIDTCRSSVVVKDSGLYSLIVTNEYGCTDTSNNIEILVNELPYFSLGNDTCIYSNQSVVIGTEGDFYTYLWNTGDTINNIIVSGAECYDSCMISLNVTDSVGCSYSDTITVYIIPFTNISQHIKNEYIKIYPNPSPGKFYIDFINMNDQPAILEIFNMEGKMIMNTQFRNVSKNIYEIDLSGHKNGIYSIVIKCKFFIFRSGIVLK